MNPNRSTRLAIARLRSMMASNPLLSPVGLAAVVGIAGFATSASAQTTLASGQNSYSTATSFGTITRDPGASLLLNGTGYSGTATATNGIVPWAIGFQAGTAANNSANGYTFLTSSLASYTTATAVTAGGAWGGTPSGGTGTINYDQSGASAATGIARNFNSLRYTGASGTTQTTNNSNFVALTVNAFMNAGGGTYTIGSSSGNVLAIAAGGSDLVFAPAAAGITFAATGRIYNQGTTNNGAGVFTNGASASSVTIAGVGSNQLNMQGGAFHTGATYVNGGTLAVTGAGTWNNTSGIFVNGSDAKYLHTSSVASTRAITLTNGSIDGTGSIGAVTVADNALAKIANGNGGTTALTAASLTFNGDATVNLNLNGTAAGLAVTGALSTTPASGSVVINATNSLWSIGSNSLITYGSFGGSASDFTVGTINGLTGRQTAGALSASGGVLSLSVTGDTPVWSGASGNVWNTASSGVHTGPNSWALKTAQTGTNFWATDNVEFNDTYNTGSGDIAVGVRNIDIQGANVSPTGVIFNNSTGDYTVGSSTGNGIASGTIIKNGSGTATILSNNTTTGAITINAGTLQLGNGTTDGSFASASSITNNAALVYNLAGGQSYNNAINGTGSVTKQGAGTLSLGGNNGFTGGLNVNGGSVSISNANALGATNNVVTLGGGTLQTTNTSALTINRAISVGASGGTLAVNGISASGQGARVILGGTNMLTGSGQLDIKGNGTLDTAGGSGVVVVTGSNSFNGNINVSNGGLFEFDNATAVAAGATFTMGANSEIAVTNANRVMPNNITVNGAGAVLSFNNVGSASYSSPITLNNDVQFGLRNWWNYAASQNGAVSGVISGNGGISTNRGTSTGAPVLTLSAVNTFSGNTNIGAGTTLRIGGAGQLGAGSYSGGITNDGTLDIATSANQTLSGPIFASGSLVQSGTGTTNLTGTNNYSGTTSVTAGTLRINGNSSGATGNVTVGAAGTLGGTGSIGGATTINGTLAPGNSPGIITFTNNLTLAGTVTFEINGAGRGVSYDGIDMTTTSSSLLTYGGTQSLSFNAPITIGTYDLISLGLGVTQTGDFSAVSASGTEVGSFANLTLTPGTGWTAQLTDLSSNIWTLSFNNATGDLSIVPEPATYGALAGAAALALAALRRRRKA